MVWHEKLQNSGRTRFKKGVSSWNKGKPMSEETKNKISKSKMGKKPSDETKNKMKLAWKTRKKDSAETRAKKSAAVKEIWRKRKEQKTNIN